MIVEMTPEIKQLFLQLGGDDELMAGKAWVDLSAYYFSNLYNLAFALVYKKYMAEEIVSNAWLEVWKRRKELSTHKHPPSWVFWYVKRRAISEWRKEKFMFDYNSHSGNGEDDGTQPRLASNEISDLKAFIFKAAADMSPQRNRIFVLSRKDGLTNGEIAKKLGIANSTVRNKLAQSLKYLRNRLRKCNTTLVPVSLLQMADLLIQCIDC